MGQTTKVEIPFAGGMDEGVAAEYLDPNTKQISVTNGVFNKTGAIDKRIGMRLLPSAIAAGNPLTTAISAGSRLASWTRSQLSVFTQNALYQQIGAEGVFAGVGGLAQAPGIGSLPAVRPVRRPILTQQGATPPQLCDVQVGSRVMRVAAYLDPSFNIWVTTYDADSGDVYLHPTQVYTNAFPGTDFPNFCIFYLPNAPAARQVCIVVGNGAASQSIVGISYNLTANTFTAPAGIVAGVSRFDAVPFTNDPSGGFMLVTQPTATASDVDSIYCSPTFALVTTGTVVSLAGGTVSALPIYCVATWGEAVWYAYSFSNGGGPFEGITAQSADGLFTNIFDSSTGSTATTNPIAFLSRLDASNVIFTAQRTGTFGGAVNPSQNLAQPVHRCTLAGAITIWAEFPQMMSPVGRAQVINGVAMVPCIHSSSNTAAATAGSPYSLQYTLYLLAVFSATNPAPNAVPVATVAVRQVDASQTAFAGLFADFRVPLMSSSSSTRFAVSVRTVAEDIAARSPNTGAAWGTDFFLDTTLLYQSVEANSALHIACGVPMICDGDTVVEDSFTYYPEFAYLTQGGVGGVLAGDYTYAIVYTWQDSAGNLTRGAPVFTNKLTIAGAQEPTVHFNPYAASWRDLGPASIEGEAQVYAEIYRTTSGGGTFFLLDRVACSNTPNQAITYTDNTPDASIQTASVLYTTGGILDGVNPPALSCITSHKQRIFGVDETLRTVWFTTQFSPGDAPRWNEALTFQVPDGGDITAIASMDDKLVIFKSDSIWIVYGDGPALTGQGSDLTTPQRIASDVGAIDWRSVVLMPKGLMFRAQAGFFLLDRGLSVTWVGRAIKDTLAFYADVTSAVLVPTAQHVRFTVAGPGSRTGVIVYDYSRDEEQWMVFLYSTIRAPLMSACLSGGLYTLLDGNGRVWQERASTDAALYLDDAVGGGNPPQFVDTRVASAWVKIQGIQGYQRARRVLFFGERLDSVGLAMQVAINYDPSPVQGASFPSATLGNGNVRAQLHVAGAFNKCEAIQITLFDFAGANVTTGQGCRFVNVALELDNIGPVYRQNPIAVRQ